jgi:hypothetical protein
MPRMSGFSGLPSAGGLGGASKTKSSPGAGPASGAGAGAPHSGFGGPPAVGALGDLPPNRPLRPSPLAARDGVSGVYGEQGTENAPYFAVGAAKATAPKATIMKERRIVV